MVTKRVSKGGCQRDGVVDNFFALDHGGVSRGVALDSRGPGFGPEKSGLKPRLPLFDDDVFDVPCP